MSAGNTVNGHGQDGKPKGKRNTCESGAKFRKCGNQNSTAAATEDQPDVPKNSADSLCKMVIFTILELKLWLSITMLEI